MSDINVEQPPLSTAQELTEYMVRQLVNIKLALNQSGYFEPRTTFPSKVQVGQTYYFTDAIPTTPITGEGLWIYKSTGWIQIA